MRLHARWFTFWHPSFWPMVLGNREYRDRLHWLTSCVVGRLVMAGAAMVALVVLCWGSRQAFGQGWTTVLSYGVLATAYGVFVILLSFGSGRNYERLCYRLHSGEAISGPEQTDRTS